MIDFESLEQLEEIQLIAREALQRKENNRIEEENLQASKNLKFDYGRTLYEEYDEESNQTKFKVDTFFYSNLLNNLDDSLQESVQELYNRYTNKIHNIYEYSNYQPIAYNVNMNNILENNDYALMEITKNIIHNYIKENYYNLTPEQKRIKYFDRCEEIASENILESQLDPKEAVEYGVKVALMEDLLHNINFPQHLKQKIEEDTIDETYSKMFNQERLKEMWEDYLLETHNLAKIIGALI